MKETDKSPDTQEAPEPQLTAAQRYKARPKPDQQIVPTEVTVPSGAVFIFQKPGRHQTLFNLGILPQAAASKALAAWKEKGVVDLDQLGGDGHVENLIRLTFALRDRVFQLSIDPKIVPGVGGADNELGTDEIAEPDLEFLLQWVASGGELAAEVEGFPGGAKSGAAAGGNRRERRAAAKQARGTA